MEVPQQILDEVGALYERTLYVQALRRAEELAPLREWQGAAVRVLAGRVAAMLGAVRLAFGLHFAAYREHPSDPTALLWFGYHLSHRAGPLQLWEHLAKHDDLVSATELAPEWRALHTDLYGEGRDFQSAEYHMDAALELRSEHAWLHACRAELLQRQDRYEEALEAGRAALPCKRSARPPSAARRNN